MPDILDSDVFNFIFTTAYSPRSPRPAYILTRQTFNTIIQYINIIAYEPETRGLPLPIDTPDAY
jgi:hypothetical protein